MKAAKSKTKPTISTAGKPAATTVAPAKAPPKGPIERVFRTVNAMIRFAARAERMSSNWAPAGKESIDQPLADFRGNIEMLGSVLSTVAEQLKDLKQAGYAPKGGGTASTKVVLGPNVHVMLKPKARDRVNYLTDAQLENLYIKAEDARGFLVECRHSSVGSPPFIVGYFKKSALVGVASSGHTVQSNGAADDSDDLLEAQA